MAMAVRKQPRRLKDIANTLADGDRVREMCPFCGGGSTGEASFSMSREGSSASYICYRASCGSKGRVTFGGISSPINIQNSGKPTAPKINRFLGDSHKLTVNYLQFFKNKFGIQPVLMNEFSVKMTDDGRVLFPIISPTGAIRGDNVRYYKELGISGIQNVYKPKAVLYAPDKTILQSWYRLRNNKGGIQARDNLTVPYFYHKKLVVVEDQVSAIKASRMIDAVALLGTTLNFQKILEISEEVSKYNLYDQIIILLDGDAYAQAISQMMRTRAILPGVCVRRLDKDIKDMTYADLNELLKEATTSHVK